MAYVKISDPTIIDLAAWHQVINVVNQHSDSIASLTNNYGFSWNPVTDGDDWSTPFDPGSQQIVFGRAVLNTNSTGTDLVQTHVKFHQDFSQNPLIVATVNGGSSPKHQAVATVSSITTSDFTLNVGNLPSTNTPTSISVNWFAIGPK